MKKKNHKSEYEEGFWLVNNIKQEPINDGLLHKVNCWEYISYISAWSSRWGGGRVPSLSTPRSTPVLASRKRQSQALLVGCGLFGSSGGDEQLDAMQYFLYWNWYFCTIIRTLSKLYVHIQISRDLQFQLSFSLWMSVVRRRPFPLTSTGPRFAQYDASVLPNSLNRPSISSSVFLGSLCVPGASRT